VNVFVAGASGAVGRPLVRRLVEAGHEVLGTTRSPEKAEQLRTLGAKTAVLDALDTDALKGAAIESQPDVVINQLTRLPDRLNYRRAEETFGPTNELRGRVGPALAAAAAEAGARRLIAQSICFYYAPTGKAAHT
jgi:2-alkyl-3-oxoalkanoate reductase